LPEVRADPNIVTEPGYGGFGRLVPYVNLSAGWYEFQAWLAEIERQAGRLQIIGALHAMHVIQCLDCLFSSTRSMSATSRPVL
jgi:hypothetical protein